MTGFWQSRNPRERILLTGAGLVAVALLLVQFAWLPLDRWRARAAQDRAAAADLLAEMTALEQRIATARPTGAAIPGAPGDPAELRALIVATAQARGLGIVRLEPDGERLGVWIEAAEAVALHGWLDELRSVHGIRVARAALRGNDDDRTLRAQLLLGGTP